MTVDPELRSDGLPLVLAGLWDGWRDPETETVRRTFTIVTTAANELIADLHDRMPVVLPRDAWMTWLNPRPVDPGELHALLIPSDDEPLEIYPVVGLVNNVRNDGPALVAPLVPA